MSIMEAPLVDGLTSAILGILSTMPYMIPGSDVQNQTLFPT